MANEVLKLTGKTRGMGLVESAWSERLDAQCSRVHGASRLEHNGGGGSSCCSLLWLLPFENTGKKVLKTQRFKNMTDFLF